MAVLALLATAAALRPLAARLRCDFSQTCSGAPGSGRDDIVRVHREPQTNATFTHPDSLWMPSIEGPGAIAGRPRMAEENYRAVIG